MDVCRLEAVNSHAVLQGFGEGLGPAETRAKSTSGGQNAHTATHRGKQNVFWLTNHILSGFNAFTGVSPLTFLLPSLDLEYGVQGSQSRPI